jgi:hypothetical protein
MTYSSRGRSIVELVVAAVFIGFLTGFVAVLCIGNYYRAKQAMERQRQRRLARLSRGGATVGSAGGGAGGTADSPRSHFSSNTSGGSTTATDERQHLLAAAAVAGPPELPRRRNNEGVDLLQLADVDRQSKFSIVRV